MQQDRGHAPYPVALEMTLIVMASLVCLLVLGVHAGRAVATVLAGGGLVWPTAQELVVSVPAVLGGDAQAGLADVAATASATPSTSRAVPGVGLLRWSIAVTELILLALAGWAAAAALQQWGPARLKGMASRDEAEEVLGLSRLRRVRAVIRPDLHTGPTPPNVHAANVTGETPGKRS